MRLRAEQPGLDHDVPKGLEVLHCCSARCHAPRGDAATASRRHHPGDEHRKEVVPERVQAGVGGDAPLWMREADEGVTEQNHKGEVRSP